ncbi:MAG: phosphohydrolase [Nitrospirae bacterium GWC2_46_6]|nr:MAG: phosphohydrolase [Nitrospirae bacterium GWC2_46_6]OGW22223.1 MAG: phosphohydrolase [Nitrospirae bacterium GWA2_46_11]OGW23245.1 MAG: phosphohydrolase [Nitrospirae bacterium GWB2_47_37]HAK89623.1 phosphohydrolase [Nitrospiraceae bacterium]HCL81565.1 phosphohydrolase [Nitrospiraceae bacterium]
MNAVKIIEKYYEPDSTAYHFLIHHSKLVAHKALQTAERVKELNPDFKFIEEASMLHDIGIFMTHAPKIGCYGFHPYISHGYLGKEILEKEGLPIHALVCERHVGTGLTIADIEANGFPLPKRDMLPISIEEKIICFADKFYSKREDSLTTEKSVSEIREIIVKFGDNKLKQFDEWLKFFKEPS